MDEGKRVLAERFDEGGDVCLGCELSRCAKVWYPNPSLPQPSRSCIASDDYASNLITSRVSLVACVTRVACSAGAGQLALNSLQGTFC
jgi:hypothetical protein